jgi:hypothetical protein
METLESACLKRKNGTLEYVGDIPSWGVQGIRRSVDTTVAYINILLAARIKEPSRLNFSMTGIPHIHLKRGLDTPIQDAR